MLAIHEVACCFPGVCIVSGRVKSGDLLLVEELLGFPPKKTVNTEKKTIKYCEHKHCSEEMMANGEHGKWEVLSMTVCGFHCLGAVQLVLCAWGRWDMTGSNLVFLAGDSPEL